MSRLQKQGGANGCLFFLSLLSLVSLVGCSTYQTKATSIRSHLRENRPEEAIKILEPLALKPSDDQLVWLLDYGMALQQAGRLEESTQIFLQANEIAKIQDYTSLSREIGSVIMNEGMVQYKGDDYEKLLIHVQLAQNFLLRGLYDDALVEVKAVDEMLTKFRVDAKRDYEQNTYARYLSAIIWEAQRKYDDAYIDYKNVYSLDAGIELLKSDIIRSALQARFNEDVPDWKEKFGIEKKAKVDQWWKDKEMGELVLLYQQGRTAVKRARPESPRFPGLYPVYALTQRARLDIEGGPTTKFSTLTERIYSVEQVAIKTLDDDYGRLVAKRIGGVVAKEIVADQIRQKDELLGFIAWVALHVTDQADTRQWSTLPATFQVARIPLKAGVYKYSVTGLSYDGAPSGESQDTKEVAIMPGKKTFVMWRSFD